MQTMLASWVPRAGPLQRLDLGAYLRDSSSVALEPAQRLRRLAVYLDEAHCVQGPSAAARWEVFKRIYERAGVLSNGSPSVLDSAAITALGLVSSALPDDGSRARIWKVALTSARTACEADSGGPDPWVTLGMVLYEGEPSHLGDALAAFDRALGIDSDLPWARLYRAHCLHDLQRWKEAASAYALVRSHDFPSDVAWRAALAKEQRALCLMKSGAREEAASMFIEVLDAREAAIARGEDSLSSAWLFVPPYALVEAAEGVLRPELQARVRRLVDSFDEWQALGRD